MVGSSFTLPGQFGEVAAEVVQGGGLRLLLALLGGGVGRCSRGATSDPGGLRGAHVGAQDLEGLAPAILEGDPQRVQDLRGDGLLLPEESQEEVLRSHIGVVQVTGLGHGELEDLLRLGSIGELAQGDGGLPLLDRLFDPFVDLVEVRVQVGEYRGGDALSLPDQAQEDVLRTRHNRAAGGSLRRGPSPALFGHGL
jgi:hypothetical protein